MSLSGPKILVFSSHSPANSQPILDCSIPNFKFKYENSENIKRDRVSTVIFNLHQIKRGAFFMGHPVCQFFIYFLLRASFRRLRSELLNPKFGSQRSSVSKKP